MNVVFLESITRLWKPTNKYAEMITSLEILRAQLEETHWRVDAIIPLSLHQVDEAA